MGLQRKFRRIQPSLARHLITNNFEPYRRLLEYVAARGDIWFASQGEYLAWWQERENASLRITASGGICQVHTSLERAVIEKFPGEFLDVAEVRCPAATFSGEVWITIDSALEKKDLLIELLKREGILNFRTAPTGDFMLSQREIGPLLEEIEAKLRRKRGGTLFETDVRALRQVVIDKLAARNLPLLRLWYHPRVRGMIPQGVFSPRYDVDRAITNLARIRALEEDFNVPSTLYIRAFCPFYNDKAVARLAGMPWCSEIALHGEFVTNALRYGDEYRAAEAEKTHLEKLIGRPVLGVGMHGGELASNRTENNGDVIQQTKFLYDTTPAFHYYFPFRRYVNGHLSWSYTLCHALSDVRIPANRDYGRIFYEQAIARLNEVFEHHGVFVLLMHPVYFGFPSYLAQAANWPPLAKFLWQYVTRSRLGK